MKNEKHEMLVDAIYGEQPLTANIISLKFYGEFMKGSPDTFGGGTYNPVEGGTRLAVENSHGAFKLWVERIPEYREAELVDAVMNCVMRAYRLRFLAENTATLEAALHDAIIKTITKAA